MEQGSRACNKRDNWPRTKTGRAGTWEVFDSHQVPITTKEFRLETVAADEDKWASSRTALSNWVRHQQADVNTGVLMGAEGNIPARPWSNPQLLLIKLHSCYKGAVQCGLLGGDLSVVAAGSLDMFPADGKVHAECGRPIPSFVFVSMYWRLNTVLLEIESFFLGDRILLCCAIFKLNSCWFRFSLFGSRLSVKQH